MSGGRFELTADGGGWPVQLADLDVGVDRVYGRGDPRSLSPGVAIVGAREATPYGLRSAELVAGWAASRGLTVYSGCARGCDQAAHRGAIAAGGRTVAVLGCGADQYYPAGARSLLNEIESNGSVVSPFEWGARPARYRFVVRNRLIVALSLLVVVCEARVPSGTFSAVGHALELGRAVGAVPGSIYSGYSDGPNRLIADGAAVITRAEDLDTALELTGLAPAADVVQPAWRGEGADGLQGRAAAVRLLELLRADAWMIDRLALELHLAVHQVAAEVNRLVVAGAVMRRNDGCYLAVDTAVDILPITPKSAEKQR